MKKRILIAIHYLEIGGAESALIGLLSNIDYERVDVDLFIYDHRGEMMKYIPTQVNILPQITEYSMLERPIAELLRRGYFKLAFARLNAKRVHRNNLKNVKTNSDGSVFYYISESTLPYLPKINPNVKYDVAISFLTPHQFVREKVQADKYIAWIHTDYSKVYVNADKEESVWASYDNIVSISDGVTDAFLSVFPSLSEKIIVLPNLLPSSLIQEKANEFIPDDMVGDGIKILSIGRFCEAKNYDNVPHVAKILKEKGLRFRWYLIGYGDSSAIENAISETNMSEYVVILGKRDNPYPYLKHCDIYAQPSRYEGRSVTVEEAKLLCKPILLTNYPTAKWQINNGIDGVISEMDNESIASALFMMSNDGALRLSLSEYLQKNRLNQFDIINKFYSLINV